MAYYVISFVLSLVFKCSVRERQRRKAATKDVLLWAGTYIPPACPIMHSIICSVDRQNWRQIRQICKNAVWRPLTLRFHSSRGVDFQTTVLLWILTGLKLSIDRYIKHGVLNEKVFHLIRGWVCDVMKPLQWNGGRTKKVRGGFSNSRGITNISNSKFCG